MDGFRLHIKKHVVLQGYVSEASSKKYKEKRESQGEKKILSVICVLGKHSDATAGTKSSNTSSEGCILILK